YDTPIIGYGTQNINTLRLWKSEAIHPFNFKYFNEQKYDMSVMEKNRAEDICRVLYPNDSNREGKLLRLRQQYFFVSASVKDLIRNFKKGHGSNFEKFPEYHVIQLNDTHPVVAIPEFMRILMDEEGLGWDDAWEIARKTFAYTNHTIMAEALEKWDIDIFRHLLPRVYEIIEAIDHRFVCLLQDKGYNDDKINDMKIILHHNIHMARLAIYGSYSINGVAHLHTEIIKHRELKHWYELYPDHFNNITNGVTPRRWMLLSNTELANFISKLLGNRDWITHLDRLKELEKYQNDEAVLNQFMQIKHNRKVELADYIRRMENIDINPNGLFDIQIKRLHEYKRQLLNALHIVYLYFKIKDNPNLDIVPRTFIFGAKAAPGYERAKAIIKYINEIARVINSDDEVNDKIRVVFVQNYNVSYAQKLFPAADISEQISTAGKEASGTGNMKFMLNGTPTVGTFDGANVEIVEEAGWDNNYIFGATVEELEKNQNHYDPRYYYESIPGLRRVVDALIDGTFKDGETGMFRELYEALIYGRHWHPADHYFVLKDFESYIHIQEKIENEYRDTLGWAKKCWLNLSNGGKFSSDRSIHDYAKTIWHIQSTPVKG
ncbi:MAG: glycogen/starch/alpha-glucan family phosphorylase, partial [Clostridia bacterium]|nr:glycogen/starch/alpha-glucan family phosphorylase [Clostridia bacterium]